MSLTALPAFTDHILWTIDDGARAIVDGPGEPGATAEPDAPAARRLEWRRF